MKITDLSNYSTPDNSDVLPIVDVVNDTTKKITRTNLFKNPPLEDGVITPKMLMAGAGATWPWQSWTPTFVNLTVGNGTLTCRFAQVGKSILYSIEFTLGSTSSVGSNPTITLPVTSKTYPVYFSMGNGTLYDNGGSPYPMQLGWLTTTTMQILAFTVSGSNVPHSGIGATTPFTWATSDRITATGIYEAA